jgi:phage terminase large subunit GpA-like protein
MCGHCAALIDEKHKREMLREDGHGGDARWVATNPEGTYPSFHLNALYSPFGMTSWASLADQWVRAHGKPADLQVFVNTALAELWTETADTLDVDIITQRLEPFERGVVPEGAGALTLGADVQENRIEWYVWGWGAGLESWLVDAGMIEGDTARDLTDPRSPYHALLHDVLPRAFVHAAGGTMRIGAAFIDSGYNTTTVYRVVRSVRGRLKLHASKGDSHQKLILGKSSPLKHRGIVLQLVGVDAAKSEFLRSQLHESTVGPGYVHFPDWLSTETCEQFVSEKRKRRVERGQVIYEWRKRSQDAANEALDCRIYARAALESMGARVIRRLGERAAAQAQQPAAPTPEHRGPPTFTEQAQQAKTAIRSARRRSWATSWRR